MKILVISQYFPPDVTAAAFRVAETVELLRRRGHEVTVVTAQPHKARAEGASTAPLADEPGVVRTPIVKYTGGGKWNYILHYSSFMVNALIAAAAQTGPADVVWATSPPLFVAVSGWAVARAKRAAFVLDVRDIWPDSAATAGQLSRDGALFRWAKRVETWAYANADAITCVAKPMAAYIAERAPEGKPISIAYNGVPQHFLDEARAAEARTDAAPKALDVAYVGNLGHCQNVELLIQAARTLRAESISTPLHFDIVGSGVEKERLARLAREERLDEVAIRGPVSKDEAIHIVNHASALFLQLRDDGTMEKTIPSKVFDYMIAGRPVIYGIEGEGRQLLERSGGNLYFQPGSLDGLVGALKRLANEWPQLTEKARANREVVAAEFTRERIVDVLEAAFQNAASARARADFGGMGEAP